MASHPTTPRAQGLSSATYSLLRDALPDALFVHDLNGQFVDVNEAACASLGYSRDELLTMSVFDVEEEHHFFLSPERWQRFADVGDTTTLRGVHRRRDGSRIDVEVRLRALTLDGEQLIAASARPVEPAEDAATRLAAAQHSELFAYRKLFECSNNAIAIIDHEGKYLQQNPTHAKLLGYSDNDILDKTPAVHLGPATFQEIATELAEKGSLVGEYESRTKDGRVLRIELTAFKVDRGESVPPIFVGIKRDVNEVARQSRERAERERSELEASLRQSQKMELIGQLAAGVAHDFNNLLTPILGLAELETHARTADDRTIQAFQEILDAARRGSALTRQLLAFGRRQVLEMRTLDLRQEIETFQEMIRRLIPAHIEIQCEIEDGLHPIHGDANQIQQVLMNLATNARDAMPEGGRMTLEARNVVVDEDSGLIRRLGSAGTYVCVAVGDNGIGMPESTLDHVYEPFFTRKKDQGGTGLGLSIVYGIVRQHGGYIEGQSEPGRGTTFRIYLPRSTDLLVVTPEAPAPSESTRHGETVLVVEDEPQVRSLVARVLESQGYHVITATDGEDALRVAEAHSDQIDMLLTDVVMPGRNGREVYEALAPSRPGLRVLYMSGYARDVLGDGESDTSIEMIEKPFTASELSRRVREALRS